MNPANTNGVVRSLRTKRGLSQQALAERSGVSLRTIVNIEQGKDSRVATLSAIAETLGVPVADLLMERAS